MPLDRRRALDAFAAYAARYNDKDPKVRLKIDHTYRVAALCGRIARAQGLDAPDIDLAWLCGLLHDVGRFEQLRRYGTFNDAASIDHAACSVQVLFDEGHIRDYLPDPDQDALLRTAVACHSAYRLPGGLDARTLLYCSILRDADKIDILRVNVETPLEEIYNVTTAELRARGHHAGSGGGLLRPPRGAAVAQAHPGRQCGGAYVAGIRAGLCRKPPHCAAAGLAGPADGLFHRQPRHRPHAGRHAGPHARLAGRQRLRPAHKTAPARQRSFCRAGA